MYPTLYHASHDVLGLDLQVLKLINTFGFFVALAFLGAARCLASELARKHAAGWMASTPHQAAAERPTTLSDAFLSGMAVFLVAFKFFGVALGKYALIGGADAQDYLLSSKGHLGAGFLCGLAWTALKLRARATSRSLAGAPEFVELLPQDHTLAITGAAALGGLIGAKIFSFLERPRSIVAFFEHPSISAIFSGLTIYGGLIVGGVFVFAYTRRNKLSFAHVCDANAPGLMLAYGIGRLGCQLAGDGDWGIANPHPPPPWIEWLPPWIWSFDYPNNVVKAGVPMLNGGYPGYGTHLVPSVWPTPLYEAVIAGIFFWALWHLRARITQPWMMFGAYLALNGFERFWIEKIRINATYDLWGAVLTQAEIIAVLIFFGGAGLMWYGNARRRAGLDAVPNRIGTTVPEPKGSASS